VNACPMLARRQFILATAPSRVAVGCPSKKSRFRPEKHQPFAVPTNSRCDPQASRGLTAVRFFRACPPGGEDYLVVVVDPHQLFYSVLAMNALFASLAWCLAKPSWASIVAVLVSAALWPFINKSLEGRTLIVFSPNHGIHSHDLLAVLAVVVAAVQAVRYMMARHHDGD
jgi:hypothetical protein